MLFAGVLTTPGGFANAAEYALQKSDKARHIQSQPLRDLPVYARQHPGYERPSSRLGSFILQPDLRVIEVFNDNIFAAPNNTRSDLITALAPELVIKTVNGERGFRFSASSLNRFYKNNTRENTDDYNVDLRPYLAINHALKATAKLSYDDNHEQRAAPDAVNNRGAEEPIEFRRTMARFGLDYKPGKVGIAAYLERADFDFDNTVALNGGPVFINDDRNRNEDEVGATLSCDITDRSTVYWDSKFLHHDYDRADYSTTTTSYSGPERDSKGVQSVLGLRFPITHIINADISAGYRHQSFDDLTLRDVGEEVGQAKLSWQATALTTVDISAERRVFETIQPGASAFANSTAGVHAYHELRRNIILDGQVSWGQNDYIGINRDDDLFGAGLGATYKMNRYLHWRASYDYDTRDSDDPAADYDRNRIFLTAKVQF